MSKKVEINEKIGGTQVRYIDENGVQKGVISLREALYNVRELGLDLVKIADSNPPVCRAVDAGKYMYDLQKAEKLQAKKQRENAVDLKEVQLRPGTDIHDVQIKARKAREFLADGDKVKVVVRLHGRERSMKHKGHEIIASFLKEVGDHKPDGNVSESGNQIMVVISSAVAKPVKSDSTPEQ